MKAILLLVAMLGCRSPAPPVGPAARSSPVDAEPDAPSSPVDAATRTSRDLPAPSYRIVPGPRAQVTRELRAAVELAGYTCEADADGDPSCTSTGGGPRVQVWLSDREGVTAINLMVRTKLPPQTTCEQLMAYLAEQAVNDQVTSRCQGGELGLGGAVALREGGIPLYELQRHRRLLEVVLIYALARHGGALE